MKPLIYSECPRCGGPWDKKGDLPKEDGIFSEHRCDECYTCSRCKLQFHSRPKEELIALRHFLGRKGYHLAWDIQTHICMYVWFYE